MLLNRLTRLRWRQGSDILLIAAFLSVIALPCTLMRPELARHLIEQTEFRRAAPYPQLEGRTGSWWNRPKAASLHAFPKGFEAWFNDSLGLRRNFIQLHSLAKLGGCISEGALRYQKEQMAGAPVLVGEEGWLFYSGERMAEDFTAVSPFTPAELEHWAQAFEARAAWLAERNCLYVLFFAPNPQTIYPEFVPASVGRIGGPSRLDQIKQRLAGSPNLVFIDLRSDLIEAKQQRATYRKSDTHWNDYGAYVGYRAVMTELEQHLAKAAPEPLDHFEIRIQTTLSEGNLARMLNSPLPILEDEVRLIPRAPRQAMVPPPRERPTYGHVTIRTNAPLSRAVIVHDSFYPYMKPFFEEHWQRLCSVATLDFPVQSIEQERPVVVFQEMVERKLMVLKPVNRPEVAAALHRRALAKQPAGRMGRR